MNETSEIVRQHYQAQLGTEFGAAFHGLRNEWAWGLMRVNEFRNLFTGADDVALLNAITGGGFTWDIQHILWDDLLLRVCRLTDPCKSAGKHNLTVTRLPSFCEEEGSGACPRRCSAASKPRSRRQNLLVIGGTGASAMRTGTKPWLQSEPLARGHSAAGSECVGCGTRCVEHYQQWITER